MMEDQIKKAVYIISHVIGMMEFYTEEGRELNGPLHQKVALWIPDIEQAVSDLKQAIEDAKKDGE